MEKIVVDTRKLNHYADRLAKVNQRIDSLDRRLDSLYTRVGLVGLWNLIQADALTGYSSRLTRCQTYLKQTASDFESVEKAVIDCVSRDDRIPSPQVGATVEGQGTHYWKAQTADLLRAIRKKVSAATVGLGIAESALSLLTSEGWKKFRSDSEAVLKSGGRAASAQPKDNVLYTEFESTEELNYGQYKDKSFLGDEDRWNVNKEQKKTDIHQYNSDEEFYDSKGTILEGKLGAAKKTGVFSADASGDSKWAEGSAEVDVLTAEGHVEASGGLYVYEKDKDGNVKRILSPGVSAVVGASVSALAAETEGRVGLGDDKNILGAYGGLEAEALSAEAEVKVALNLKEVYLGASTEANLAKVEGTVGVSVLGTDLGVTGGLKIGAGAHAEVGYTDGVLKVDVGAALGVGFDLGFEMDVSGTVDAVVDVATDAWDGITNAWDGATDLASDAWNGISGLWSWIG